MKKVAFFRQTNPFGIGLAVRVVNKLKRMFFAPSGHRARRVVGAGSRLLWRSRKARIEGI